MSLGEFVRTVTSHGVRFRWFTCHCTEIKLPNGKYIVIDPFLPSPEDPRWGRRGMSCGYSVDDLEGCDYVIVNHGHGDHVLQLGEVYKKFHPYVLCHESTAIAYSQTFGITERDIFPFSSNDTYDFGDFILETTDGRHNATAMMRDRPVSRIEDHASLDYLSSLGSLFNTNFIITTTDSLKIGFSSGEWNSVIRKKWEDVHPNVLFRHRTDWQMDPDEMAAIIAEIGAQISLPWHHNNSYDPDYDYDFNDFIARVNDCLAARGSGCKMINPERGKWYEIDMVAKMCD